MQRLELTNDTIFRKRKIRTLKVYNFFWSLTSSKCNKRIQIIIDAAICAYLLKGDLLTEERMFVEDFVDNMQDEKSGCYASTEMAKGIGEKMQKKLGEAE